MKYLDLNGLSRFLTKIKALIPSKTSELTNDSGYITTYSNDKVTQTYTTTSANYPLLMKNASGITSTTSPTAVSRFCNKLYGNPNTGYLYATEFYRNGTALGGASVKDVDTSISAGSTSANLPTSQAVASFVEGKGYVTANTQVTQTYTTTSANYPLLMKNASGTSATTSPTATARYGNKIYGNPSTGALYATEFYRNGTALGSASYLDYEVVSTW